MPGEPPDVRDPARRLRLAVTRLLAYEAAGDRARPEDVAAAAGHLLDRLSQQLAQVVGHAGVNALVRRAVSLCKHDFPFLDERVVAWDPGETGPRFRARLEGEPPERITAAAVAVIATFAELLAALIGERLAWNLMRDVWPETLRSETDPRGDEP